jgi:hypothetical protein
MNKKEKIDVKLSSPLNVFGYSKIFDKVSNRVKVKLVIFKGDTIAGRELTQTDNVDKKLRMIKIKTTFIDEIHKLIEPIDGIQAREVIEDVNIDYNLLYKFFIKEFGKYVADKISNQIIDKLDDDKRFKSGDKILELTLDYDDFIKLVKFLSILVNDFENKKVNI